MAFASRLPCEAQGDRRYSVKAPQGGLRDKINELLRGNTPFVDFAVFRDFTDMHVRVFLDPNELIQKSDTVYRIESATGILLDEDGRVTGGRVTVTGSFNTEVVSSGMPAGVLAIWNQSRETKECHEPCGFC